MSKSLDFCLATARDQDRSSFADRPWDQAIELCSKDVFDQYVKGSRSFRLDGETDEGEPYNVTVQITIDPDADFTYFTSSSHIHDGTLMFFMDCVKICVRNVLYGTTYKSDGRKPKNGDTIHYTVGNFVVLNEYDESGDLFAPPDKPWMKERTTVLLPLAVDIT